MEEILKVLDILKDYYGEDRIEHKDNAVIIYFPHVTVTNENDRSTDVTELYVKININSNGTMEGTFSMTRSEYTYEQYYSDYCHSHVNGIGNPADFKSVCLGNGPIKETCASLNISFDEDIWRLFAFELDKYVHTESLAGIPYRHLEKIGCPRGRGIRELVVDIPSTYSNRVFAGDISDITMEAMNNKFIPYVIEHKPFRFSYSGRFDITDRPYIAVVKLSNLFIEWYNSLTHEEQGDIKQDLFEHGGLILARLDGIHICERSVINRNQDSYKEDIGKFLFTFKGNPVTLNITGIPDDINIEEDDSTSVVLNPLIVMSIVENILKIVNYRYGNKRIKSEPGKKTVYI